VRDRFTIRLPQDLAEWLDRAADESGMSRGAIIRMELERAGAQEAIPPPERQAANRQAA